MGKIFIFGAGRVGRALLKIVEKQKHAITIIEEKKDRCDELAAESNATVINGDVADPKLLDELKVMDADYIFAVTGSEETNFLAAVYAKQAGALKVISRVSEARYSMLLEKLGIETVISEYTLASDLANRISSPTIFKLLNPLESNIELVEKEVDETLADMKIVKVNKEKRFNVIATFHKGKFHVADPEHRLKEGMKIIIVRER